jgi:transcriptional regulator with XRE-family HTH domain
LAAAAGVSSGRVTQWLQGDVKGLSAESAINIEEVTGFSARWLVKGKAPKKIITGGIKLEEASYHAVVDNKQKVPLTQSAKLVEIVRIFQETDDIGKDAIWAGARIAMKRATRIGKRASTPRPVAG